MPRRTIGAVVGALAASGLLLAAPLAQAGTPAKVSVRVESLARTLVSRSVTTSRAPVEQDGHTCSGTSALGALQLATGGRWTATWYDGLGFSLDSVQGVRPTGSDYWTLWLNGRYATTGLCDSELSAGDQVLEFICHDAQAPDYSCKNRPLALVGPRGRVQQGVPTPIRVVELADDGSASPAPGANVAGGVRPARANGRGVAMVTLPPGQSALRATRAGDVPSAALHCVSGEESATCGSRDRVPPTLLVNGIADGQAFMANQAPRTLRGTARDPEGVSVSLRLTRTRDGRCAVFQPVREAFGSCRGVRPWVLVGDRARWSYLLPSRLGAGAYALTVRAADVVGNVRKATVRFTVEA